MSNLLGCVCWAIFLLLVSAWTPIFGPFFSLLTPLPFLYYSIKFGPYQAMKLVIFTALIIAIIANLLGQLRIILVLLEFSALGLVLAEFFRRNISFGYTILLATVFMLLLGMGSLFFIGLNRDMSISEMLINYFDNNIQATFKTYQEVAINNKTELQLASLKKAFISIISKIYPSLIIIGAGFTVWFNIVISKPFFELRNLNYPDFGPLDRWKTQDQLVWGGIVAGVVLFLSSGYFSFIAINVLIVIMVIYLFHGISIVLFYLNKYHIPSWVRIGVYLLIIVQHFFLAILALMGLFDQWMDFRKIHKKIDS